jgi:tetratricopeptide (TPR) repeat protein
MKRISLLTVASIFVLNANAQSAKVVTAYRYLQDFNSSKDAESLTKAKEAIDLASEHPDTKDNAKTQVYKANIYMAIFENNLRLATEKSTETDPNKKQAVGYQTVSGAELTTAYQAYAKAKTLDTKGNYPGEIGNGIAKSAAYFSNKGSYDYNAKKFGDALNSFEMAYTVGEMKDTNLLYNCAVTAERSANYDKAKTYYQKMVDIKQGRGNTYSSLMNAYLMAKDTTGGMDVLKKGRAAYPNDINLLISETNYYLKTNQSVAALSNLTQAITAKPADANLYLVRGNIYDNLANPKDETGKELAKPKDYEEKFKNAETDYKKAIELKPDYFDALYNLGALYNNQGVAISKMADQITDQKKYEAELKRASDAFNNALPVLEKALEVNQTDKNTMYALKQIYSRTQQLDKLKALNTVINGSATYKEAFKK